MKNNILLFIFVLVISLATASYFGGWYDYFVPQYDYSLLGIDQETVVYIAGLFFAYVFFVPFIRLIASLNSLKVKTSSKYFSKSFKTNKPGFICSSSFGLIRSNSTVRSILTGSFV